MVMDFCWLLHLAIKTTLCVSFIGQTAKMFSRRVTINSY